MGLGSGIRKKPILDPRSMCQKGIQSRIQIRNTASINAAALPMSITAGMVGVNNQIDSKYGYIVYNKVWSIYQSSGSVTICYRLGSRSMDQDQDPQIHTTDRLIQIHQKNLKNLIFPYLWVNPNWWCNSEQPVFLKCFIFRFGQKI